MSSALQNYLMVTVAHSSSRKHCLVTKRCSFMSLRLSHLKKKAYLKQPIVNFLVHATNLTNDDAHLGLLSKLINMQDHQFYVIRSLLAVI